MKNRYIAVAVIPSGETEACFKDRTDERVIISTEGDVLIGSTVFYPTPEFKRLVSVARYSQGSYK